MAVRRRNKFDYILYQDGVGERDEQSGIPSDVIIKPHDYNRLKSSHARCWRSIWTEFKSKTTAHGIPNIDQAQGLTRRILWIVVFVFGLICCLINTSSLLQKYVHRTVFVSTSVRYQKDLNFPAVTVCNANPILLSKMKQVNTLNSLLQEYETYTKNSNKREQAAFQESHSKPRVKREAEIPPLPPEDYEEFSDPEIPPSGRNATKQRKGGDEKQLKLNTSRIIQNSLEIISDNPIDLHAPTITPNETPKDISPFEEVAIESESLHKTSTVKPNLTEHQENKFVPEHKFSTEPSRKQNNSILSGDLLDSSDHLTEPPTQSNPVKTKDSDLEQTLDMLSKLYGTRRPKVKPTIPETSVPPQQSTQVTESTPKQNHVETPAMFDKIHLSQSQSAKSVFYDNLIARLATLPWSEKIKLSTEINQFVSECEYSGHSCNMTEDFHGYYDVEWGSCFTFNSGLNNKSLKADSLGRKSGLHLTLRIDASENILDLFPGSGARIVVHPQGTSPSPSDQGISASPSFATFVSLKQKVILRSEACREDAKRKTVKNVFEEQSFQYNIRDCFKTCYQKNVAEKCGCGDSRLPLKIRPCTPMNISEVSCLRAVEATYISGQLACNCQDRCREVIFIPTVSSLALPSEPYPVKLPEEDSQEKERSDQPAGVDLLKLIVHFHDLHVEYSEEIETYSADKLLSDLGGTLALFIGFSAITLLEFGELMLDFLVLGLIKMYNVANRRAVAARRNSKAKVEPFVTRESCGETPADTVSINQEISHSCAIPCQMQNLEY